MRGGAGGQYVFYENRKELSLDSTVTSGSCLLDDKNKIYKSSPSTPSIM